MLEKTIPVAVKNRRGWRSRMPAGDRKAQAENRKTIRRNESMGKKPSMNDKPRSVLEMRALGGKKFVLTLKCEVLINMIFM